MKSVLKKHPIISECKDFTSPSDKSPVVPYKLIMIVSVYIVSVMQIVCVHGWTWAVQKVSLIDNF